MTGARAALLRAERRLADRVDQLDERLGEGGDCWPEFIAALHALAVTVAQLRSDPTELLTTAAMAERLSIAPKTLRKKARAGEIAAPIRLSKRGPGALRWRAQA